MKGVGPHWDQRSKVQDEVECIKRGTGGPRQRVSDQIGGSLPNVFLLFDFTNPTPTSSDLCPFFLPFSLSRAF